MPLQVINDQYYRECPPPGYGNLTPRTSLGKVVTMLYALTGIPLMFIYMANIGSILATSFKYTYSKMCRCCSYQAPGPSLTLQV